MRTLLRDDRGPGNGNTEQQTHDAQGFSWTREKVDSQAEEQRPQRTLKDEWATANCVGALETSPTEDTVVLWPGDLEMNYMDRAAEGAW